MIYRRCQHRGSVASPPVSWSDVITDMPPVLKKLWSQVMANDDCAEIMRAVNVPKRGYWYIPGFFFIDDALHVTIKLCGHFFNWKTR